MGNRSMFAGRDVHKETIDVSIAEGDRQGEVRHYGVIASDLEPLDKVVRALRAIDVPADSDEAMRDLVRAREDTVVVGTQATDRLKACLLRQGRRYPGREGWTIPYRRWLADLRFPSAAQHIALASRVLDDRKSPAFPQARRDLAPPILEMQVREPGGKHPAKRF